MVGRTRPEFLYRRALGIARKTLPADHPYIATSLQNLSNLYRAQGKPEKLAQVADGRSQRSGLPGIDSPDEAVMEGERPADIIPGQADASAHSRSQTLYERLAHQPVLLVAAAVVLLVVAWLLWGYSLYSSPYYRLWWRFFFRPRIPLTIAA